MNDSVRAARGAADPWAPYTPSPDAPWNRRRVVCLHRGAAFAATWAEIERDVKDGPEASIDRLLSGETRAGGNRSEFSRAAEWLADAAVPSGDPERLKAWWMYRMLLGTDSVTEKLTLLWHDHFATSNLKVNDLAAMRRQNETLRRHAKGRFSDLLNASVREPALLLWLDAPSNRKGHANENLARELMELFTLGVGHYTENDIKEAARALTGWSVRDGLFAENAAEHDAGAKTVLGRTGNWTGTDIVQLLLNEPATAERVATKLCGQFFGENALPLGAVAALAAGLRAHDLDIDWAVRTIVRSRLFFADANLGTRVLGPVEFVIGAARALEFFEPAPSTLALAAWSGWIGQDLFYPPNVGGWPGGRTWLHARTMIARANCAAALVSGRSTGRPQFYDPTTLPRKYGLGTDAASVLAFHHRLLFGTDPSNELRRRVDGLEGRDMVVVLLSSPEGQLA
jgi:hypothetical protein